MEVVWVLVAVAMDLARRKVQKVQMVLNQHPTAIPVTIQTAPADRQPVPVVRAVLADRLAPVAREVPVARLLQVRVAPGVPVDQQVPAALEAPVGRRQVQSVQQAQMVRPVPADLEAPAVQVPAHVFSPAPLASNPQLAATPHRPLDQRERSSSVDIGLRQTSKCPMEC